ncbi:unnamed protein product [Spirodela intermedia]|uniref:Uncharacterized protein n=1 Tax=Spirodela intermedia TaxID=51605 RepID=A0A7I8KBD4_SPIIN|nr:unnamed protein product [Spirodela intermedia]
MMKNRFFFPLTLYMQVESPAILQFVETIKAPISTMSDICRKTDSCLQ